LLTGEPVTINDVPPLRDVQVMGEVLESLGAEVNYNPILESVTICARNLSRWEPPAAAMKQMRASFLVLGPLLARFRRARMVLPGGCAIGSRPVDLHLKGLAALGGDFTCGSGIFDAVTDGLKGAKIYLDYPSVGATENIIMAATLARGITLVENAATEPEVVDLANFLNSMGARVSGAGTNSIRVEGVGELGSTTYTVIPDRIEAGTLLLAGAITRGELLVENLLPDHLKPLLAKLTEAGVSVEESASGAIRVSCPGPTEAVDLKTLPYPGFPTDLQPQFMVLLALSRGTSLVTETVFENRFKHVRELQQMGAQINICGHRAVIRGKKRLTAAAVKASDLRAAAGLVLAGLAVEGTTEIAEAAHLWRGYSGLEQRLRRLGADIKSAGPVPPHRAFG
ncbi:MAG: UDP-N-acetylglucosamine 1-carboxyvinyltransferase, partial [Firmicutes bacterium]|nr:UDP-N-acetylglucosamine 1-carboxyvinyltransferase [Bacillota bacterium]